METLVKFHAYFDPNRTGNPDAPNTVTFDEEQLRLIQVSADAEKIDPHVADNAFQITVVDVPFQKPVRLSFEEVEHGGRIWQPTIPDVYVNHSETPEVLPIFFVPVRPRIHVQAHIGETGKRTLYRCGVYQDGGEVVPAQFALYGGPVAKGQPLATLQTNAVVPAAFEDLEPGTYTIAVTPLAAARRPELELVAPAAGVVTTIVKSGEAIDLGNVFQFGLFSTTLKVNVIDGSTGEPVEGCTTILTLAADTKPAESETSNADGLVLFTDVAAGSYHVQSAAQRFRHNGIDYEVESMAPVAVTVGRGQPAIATLRVQRDIHAIEGSALLPDGTPIAYGVIDVYTKLGHSPLDSIYTDENGAYYWLAPGPGTYYLSVHEEGGAPTRRTEVVVNSVARRDIFASGPTPDSRGNGFARHAGARNLTGSGAGGNSGADPGSTGDPDPTVDLAAYPVWTEEVGAGLPTRSPATGGGGTAALGQIAEGALRDVLGWKPDTNKPQAFVSALTQSFALKEVEGHTEWTWTPKSYAVQTDMGAVTGAQASIFNRATVALDQCTPLLDGLYPLRADILAEDLESMRAVVKSQLAQLVSEFGVLGGPRPQRVDELFRLLMGDATITNPEAIGGLRGEGSLFTLRDRFGLDRDRVNTIADEQDLTNYLILVDYVIGLAQSWSNQRAFFDVTSGDGPEPFLGTQLVLISRALDVVSELVDDANFAMDSVFLGPAERGSIQLRFATAPLTGPFANLLNKDAIFGSDLFVGDLMEWIARVARDEGPALIKDGGKDGVMALTPILDQLRWLARGALLKEEGLQDPRTMMPAYRTPRVQRAVRTLADQLDETYNHAHRLKAPALGDVAENVRRDQQTLATLTRLLTDISDRLGKLEGAGQQGAGQQGAGQQGAGQQNGFLTTRRR